MNTHYIEYKRYCDMLDSNMTPISYEEWLVKFKSMHQNNKKEEFWKEWENTDVCKRVTELEAFGFSHGFKPFEGQNIPEYFWSKISQAQEEARVAAFSEGYEKGYTKGEEDQRELNEINNMRFY